MKSLLFLLAISATVACAYQQEMDSTFSVMLHRTDNMKVQLLLNSGVVAGLKTGAGKIWITADSDVMGAVNGAVNSWNSIPSASIHFLPVTTTGLIDGTGSSNVIDFDESPTDQQTLNGAIAITLTEYQITDGTIVSSDIIFSDQYQFSTTLAAGTIDLQSVLTHEFGHTLGSGHSGVLSATMFWATGEQRTDQQVLQPDDIAFATAVYPMTATLGTITGSVVDSNGVRATGALVTLQDPKTGLAVGGITDSLGGYTFQAPPGTYQIWAEPLGGQIQPYNEFLDPSTVNEMFQPSLPGATIKVIAPGTTTVPLKVTAGASPIKINLSTTDPTGDLFGGPADVPSASVIGFYFASPGLGPDLTDKNIITVGPTSVVPGSVAVAGALTDGTPVYGLALSTPPLTARTTASLFVNYKGNTAAFSGGLVLAAAKPLFQTGSVINAFSNGGQAVAPGEIVSIYGADLGPSPGVSSSGFVAGVLGTSLGGVGVTFDGHAAPLFYAGFTGQYYQINLEVPFEVTGPSTSVVVSFDGQKSAPVTLPVLSAVPGLYPSAVNADGTLNSAANPAVRGPAGYVVLYAVGMGALPGVATGKQVTGAASLAGAMVSIGGQAFTPLYAGATPGATGLYQVNVAVPASLAAGATPMFVTVNGQASPPIMVWLK